MRRKYKDCLQSYMITVPSQIPRWLQEINDTIEKSKTKKIYLNLANQPALGESGMLTLNMQTKHTSQALSRQRYWKEYQYFSFQLIINCVQFFVPYNKPRAELHILGSKGVPSLPLAGNISPHYHFSLSAFLTYSHQSHHQLWFIFLL